MPELPEVETVVRSLRSVVVGRQITGIEFQNWNGAGAPPAPVARILSGRAAEFLSLVPGGMIQDVSRYGKHIVVRLRPAQAAPADLRLLIHLGMTGRLTVEDSPEFLSPHTHLVLSLDRQAQWLHYTDIRQFGRLRVMEGEADRLARLGPDPLSISFEEFAQLLRSRRGMLKSVLLDQRFLRGLGNIYADESLFQAGLHPKRIASRLRSDEAHKLYNSIRAILRQAIHLGGSSVSNYVNAWGKPGEFQFLHQVYRRTGQPCFRCGSKIRRFIVGSRSTHFCAQCQRGPRARTAGNPSLTRSPSQPQSGVQRKAKA